MQTQIYQITLELIEDENYFKNVLATNMLHSYYWSDNWNEAFYILLAKKGFISISHTTKEDSLLLPELQLDYGVLDFTNLHISKKVQKLIQQDNVVLSFNTQFAQVLEKISQQHTNNWLKDKYAQLMKKLHQNHYNNFKLISVELTSKLNQELISGEVGYIIGTTYTSLSGFSSKEKKYNNHGTLQLVLLAQHLEKSGFSFWNLGHPHMEYKQKLGSVTHTRTEFLKRWDRAIVPQGAKNYGL